MKASAKDYDSSSAPVLCKRLLSSKPSRRGDGRIRIRLKWRDDVGCGVGIRKPG